MNPLHSRAAVLTAVLLSAAGLQAVTLNRAASTHTDPYMEFATGFAEANPRASITALRSVEDGTSLNLPQMAGIPDGMGVYDNGNGTFTVLLNHEIGSGNGVVRAHGQRGAFVSKWTVDKNDLRVIAIEDLVQRVATWNTDTNSFNEAVPPSFSWNRFCSANVPPVTAFYNAATGKGTTARAILNGEEGGSCIAWMHVSTGPDAGTSFQLAYLGRMSYENAVPAPFPQDKTVVISTDDSSTSNSIVTVYVGDKRTEGNTAEKAGLVGGRNYGLQVLTGTGDLVAVENTNDSTGVPVSGPKGTSAEFALVELTNSDKATTIRGSGNSTIGSASLTCFARPEDGAWDPRPAFKDDFYFVCTASMSSRTRLYRMRFNDITQPELGGIITAVLDGTEGPRMMDNITITPKGKLYAQEDPGGNNRYAKIWEYDLNSGALVEVAQFKPAMFAPGGTYFNNDEESAGIVDASEILGAGRILTAAQIHTSLTARPILAERSGNASAAVEHGQLMVITLPESVEITRGNAVYNRARTTATQSVTVKNTDTAALTGPVRVAFSGLPAGTSVSNASGTTTVNGVENVPFVTVAPNGLAAGASAALPVQFSVTAGSALTADLIVVE